MTTEQRLLVTGALVLLVAAFLFRLEAQRARAPTVVADPVRTPGILNPEVTQATIRSTVCTSGWTRTVRPSTEYTNALKLRQMREYGETGPPSAYQEDHLISLELGGDPDDPRNLWPEPYPRAARVDGIENDLNRRVCDGSLTLVEAQEQESALKHGQG
jgi:hypothetical protein